MKLTNCNLIECGPPRTQSRSVSWSASGLYLAMATSDSTVRLWTLDSAPSMVSTGASDTAATSAATNTTGGSTSTASASGMGAGNAASSMGTGTGTGSREVLSITGHGGPVMMVQFHPTAEPLLASTSNDDVVLLWDVRTGTGTGTAASTKQAGKIDASKGKAPIVATQWHPTDHHILAVTTRNGTVSVYDTRKLSSITASSTAPNAGQLLATTSLAPDITDTCIFDATGDYLITGTTTSKRNSYGMGYLKVWHWKRPLDSRENTSNTSNCTNTNVSTFPAHAGPIYALASSRDGSCLVTGGSDALVGLWHTPTMTCSQTIQTRTKWIRSAAVAADNRLVAIATEENVIELVDAQAIRPSNSSTTNNISVGLASFGPRSSRSAGTGADDIAFHPSTSQYILACARLDAVAPVTIMKLSVTI